MGAQRNLLEWHKKVFFDVPPEIKCRHVDNALPERVVYAYVSVAGYAYTSVDNAVLMRGVYVSTD